MTPKHARPQDYEYFVHSPYIFCHHSEADISIFEHVYNGYIIGKKNERYNDLICMIDTETSKKKKGNDNHVCAWTASFAAGDVPFLTVWGHKPSTLVSFLTAVKNRMQEGFFYIYIHNMGYDWVFLRKFMMKEWGEPVKALNVKPYYPIRIDFANGIVLRDSLILAQRKLEKWAEDLDAPHKKAVGKWDYDKLRSQEEDYNQDELEYIEHDTLAGVECLIATKNTLRKHLYAMPYTATGIPREESRKIGKKNNAKDRFSRMAPSYEIQCILEKVFHGGFTHANRYFLGDIINKEWVEGMKDE